ncbi:NAD(P)/FAD-dependent oxidoreductase [Pedobacter sp. SYP-B3415]|uniref:protoporphyrinogen/coproporphyrinogen oxidase n=1 Tax=Pedobacter sp. SYP-B3415 TaxID=2496641 RepID=UPI00101C0441|nr:FAD-dependent oxidoreductase [Pedobacter sp. SYP-B3415]
MYTILGAGLAGLSTAHHLQQKGIAFRIFEAKAHGGGHVHSEERDGFIWDEGPHVSFTKYAYVREYFAANCNQAYQEFAPVPSNYASGNWIPHPAQANMYAVPEALREACIADVKVARSRQPKNFIANNYQEWIDYAFGETFAEKFAGVYTRKYWTTDPENLTTDWIGKRIYFPELSDMTDSASGPLEKQTHYISSVRYPQEGGYYSYIRDVESQLNITYNHKLTAISFERKEIIFEHGAHISFDKLISTLPLPLLIGCSDAPLPVKAAAKQLRCSSVLIINVVANHPAKVDAHWIYVYDEAFYSTRINFTELLSASNGITGQTGIQVEVYFSDYHPVNHQVEMIEKEVIRELIIMGLIADQESVSSYHSKWVDWANVIFDILRKEAQETVFKWLATQGLAREDDDLEPMTEWDTKPIWQPGSLMLAGRFAQWKYYWTDDCVMRARYIADNLEK